MHVPAEVGTPPALPTPASSGTTPPWTAARSCDGGFAKYQGWSTASPSLVSSETTGITEEACRALLTGDYLGGGYYYDSASSGGWCRTITPANAATIHGHWLDGTNWHWTGSTSAQNTYLPIALGTQTAGDMWYTIRDCFFPIAPLGNPYSCGRGSSMTLLALSACAA